MVDGMVCSKCTARVEKALIDAGMELARADLATGVVSVTGPGADAASLAAVVTGIGFPAVPAGE
jgi:copper chaperone CopZ